MNVTRRAATRDQTLRSMLLGILALDIVGAGTELALVGHFEDPWQWVPLGVLAGSLGTVLPVAWRKSRVTLLILREPR